ncbi:hypothetical protein BDQ17DRAFT_1249445 [Cyathus striatus]|nr:hypothetical protein BDQ17DRAFT_1249445 [Cyathus striatus]
MRLTDRKILYYLRTVHIDTTRYGLELTKFIEMREKMGLFRTRKQNHDVESIRPAMIRLRTQYPQAGAREMVSLLFHEESMAVSRRIVTSYFALYEPELVQQRRAQRLRRKRWWAAGVNDIIAVDQHDKWKYKFGLGLHTGIDPFAGKIHWLKVWHTNSNPKLILSYYLETIENLGSMPLVTQSDPGSENFGLANGHTFLRHYHDPALQGTLQHRWMHSKKNVKPEITWSQLRRRFTPGFEDILERGINEDFYHPDHTIEAMVFRWVFIPWLQSELDGYKDRVNNTAKRADRNKVLPHGVPNDIFENPNEYGVLDFKIPVKIEAIQEARTLFSPPTDPVFELVPNTFSNLTQNIYLRHGSPIITRNNVWDVYLFILNDIQSGIDIPPGIQDTWTEIIRTSQREVHGTMDLLPGLSELEGGIENATEEGLYYMGGVNNGRGIGKQYSACSAFHF